jgi:hypothetical protein
MRKHYEIEEWMEFARGTVSGEARIRMKNHLAEGCADCRQTAEFFKKLAIVCRDMIPDDVPDAVLERARAIRPLSVPRPVEQPIRIPVELIYDSSLATPAVGLRASEETGWRVLYRAGDCSLDLHVEPESRSSRIAIVGQILAENSPETKISHIPVALKSGKTTLVETLSNEFGEFQMECEKRKNMQLCVYLEPDVRFIEVPLHKFGNDKSDKRH